jgi:hypothetical protein
MFPNMRHCAKETFMSLDPIEFFVRIVTAQVLVISFPKENVVLSQYLNYSSN